MHLGIFHRLFAIACFGTLEVVDVTRKYVTLLPVFRGIASVNMKQFYWNPFAFCCILIVIYRPLKGVRCTKTGHFSTISREFDEFYLSSTIIF